MLLRAMASPITFVADGKACTQANDCKPRVIASYGIGYKKRPVC